MKILTLDVQPLGGALGHLAGVWKSGEPEPSARISFARPELLWQILTADRWALLKAMAGRGPVSHREAANLVQRDLASVEDDLGALTRAGVLRQRADGRLEFPFEAVHV